LQKLTIATRFPSGSSSATTAGVNNFFLVTGIGLVTMNVLTFGYHATGATVLNGVSNACSLLLVGCSIYFILTSYADNSFHKTLTVFACIFAGLSYLANSSTASIPDTLKYVSIYTFYLAGQTAPGNIGKGEKRCIYLLGVLPILFMLISTTKIYVGREYPDVLSYFPNTNTAALYFSALLFAFSPWLGNKVLILQFMNAILMNRVGPALATIVSIGMWSVFPLRKEVVIAFVVIGTGGMCAYAVGALDRLITGLDSIALIWSLSPGTVARMSYKELVIMTGTTDLSAFFRVIHWSDIWDLYTSQGVGVILFGFGSGQTGLITNAAMPPHNDYLRILAEYGLFSGVVFVMFVATILASLKEQAPRILFTVLLIYFISENLVDNFTSMALFFAYAGRCTAKRVAGKPKPYMRTGAWQ
jgi:hypothetical protein